MTDILPIRVQNSSVLLNILIKPTYYKKDYLKLLKILAEYLSGVW